MDLTVLEYSLPAAAAVQVRVLNTLGQEVVRLQQSLMPAGWHRLEWQRNGLAPGLYYVQLLGADFSQVTRVVAL